MFREIIYFCEKPYETQKYSIWAKCIGEKTHTHRIRSFKTRRVYSRDVDLNTGDPAVSVSTKILLSCFVQNSVSQLGLHITSVGVPRADVE